MTKANGRRGCCCKHSPGNSSDTACLRHHRLEELRQDDADRKAGRRTDLARLDRVSTVKHAHHGFDIDKPGTDSHRHREAGAHEVADRLRQALGADARIARTRRNRRWTRSSRGCRPATSSSSKATSGRRTRRSRHGGSRRGTGDRSVASDPNIVAIAADHARPAKPCRSSTSNDIPAIADFVETATALSARANRSD